MQLIQRDQKKTCHELIIHHFLFVCVASSSSSVGPEKRRFSKTTSISGVHWAPRDQQSSTLFKHTNEKNLTILYELKMNFLPRFSSCCVCTCHQKTRQRSPFVFYGRRTHATHTQHITMAASMVKKRYFIGQYPKHRRQHHVEKGNERLMLSTSSFSSFFPKRFFILVLGDRRVSSLRCGDDERARDEQGPSFIT